MDLRFRRLVETGRKAPSLCVVAIPSARLPVSGTPPTAPIVPFRWTASFAIMLPPRVFLFEGVRDAFDPRKTFG